MNKVKSKDAVAIIQHFITNQQHGIAYCVHDEKSVFMACTDTVDRDACHELGYVVLETMHNGGGVVVNEGDMSVVHFGEIGNEWMKNFALYLVEQYNARGLNATFDGNDFLIDGYKISGISARVYTSIQYSTIHIGINTNLEHIKAICTKPMVKVPKGLAEYGITTDEIEQMFLAYCEDHTAK